MSPYLALHQCSHCIKLHLQKGLTTGCLAPCLLWFESIKSDLSLSCPQLSFGIRTAPPTASDPQKLREQKTSRLRDQTRLELLAKKDILALLGAKVMGHVIRGWVPTVRHSWEEPCTLLVAMSSVFKSGSLLKSLMWGPASETKQPLWIFMSHSETVWNPVCCLPWAWQSPLNWRQQWNTPLARSSTLSQWQNKPWISTRGPELYWMSLCVARAAKQASCWSSGSHCSQSLSAACVIAHSSAIQTAWKPSALTNGGVTIVWGLWAQGLRLSTYPFFLHKCLQRNGEVTGYKSVISLGNFLCVLWSI